MIQVLPMKDREREKELLNGFGSAEARILMMTDREEEVGWAAVELDGKTLRILRFNVGTYDFSRKPDAEETMILDFLMRSAASYGENFGAERIETAFPDFFDFLRLRGFRTDEGLPGTPVGTIVRYHHTAEG